MNLWFRLLVMLLTLPLRGRMQPMGTASLTMTVMPTDLDLNGHVNNGRFLTLADVARMDYVLRSGVACVAWAERALPARLQHSVELRRSLI